MAGCRWSRAMRGALDMGLSDALLGGTRKRFDPASSPGKRSSEPKQGRPRDARTAVV